RRPARPLAGEPSHANETAVAIGVVACEFMVRILRLRQVTSSPPRLDANHRKQTQCQTSGEGFGFPRRTGLLLDPLRDSHEITRSYGEAVAPLPRPWMRSCRYADRATARRFPGHTRTRNRQDDGRLQDRIVMLVAGRSSRPGLGSGPSRRPFEVRAADSTWMC